MKTNRIELQYCYGGYIIINYIYKMWISITQTNPPAYNKLHISDCSHLATSSVGHSWSRSDTLYLSPVAELKQ